jgi:hypothetical protein
MGKGFFGASKSEVSRFKREVEKDLGIRKTRKKKGKRRKR